MWIDRSLRPRRQADHRAVPARRLDRGDRLPARLRRDRRMRRRSLLALFRIGQGVALGGAWDGLASLLALNAPENQRGWYAMIPQLGAPLGLIVASALFAYLPHQPVGRGLPRLGLALSVLRRLRDQRRRAVRAPAHRRDAGIRAPVREPRAAALAGHRDAVRANGATIVARRLRAARQLRAVPPGHGLPAVLGVPVHRAKSRCASC